MCDCEIYEICLNCAPTPEEYERVAQMRDDALKAASRLGGEMANESYELIKCSRMEWIVTCTKCAKSVHTNTGSVVRFAEERAQDGWVVKDGEPYCAECK
jgi:hypothetical protein